MTLSILSRSVLLAWLAVSFGGAAQAQNAPTSGPDSVTNLGLTDSKDFRLGPNEHATFLIRTEGSPGLRVEFEQTREMLNVKWVDDAKKPHFPRTNDAGLGAAVRFAIAGGAPEEKFQVGCLHPHLACAGTVKVSPGGAHEAGAAEQEEALAEAEDIRRHGDKTTWPVALEKFQNAAKFFETSRDPTMQRAALNGEARLLLYKLSDYQAARDAATLATGVGGGDADPQGQGLAWKTLSSAEYFLGDYEASIAAAQQAIALYQRSGDDYWQGILLGNLAYTYRETGDTDDALACSKQALEIARRLEDKYGIAFNLEALATVNLSRGDMEQAFELYYEALDATKVQPFPGVEAAIWSGLGDLYSQLNDEKRAEESFQKALPLAKEASDTAGLLKVTASLGDLYLRQGRAKNALAALDEGLKEAKKLGLVREQSILAVGVARSEATLGQNETARADFQLAVDAAGRIANKDAEASALLHFADFEYRTGNATRARELYERSFDLWMQESNRAQAATALASLARLDADAGDLQQAAKEIEDALGYFETSRATIASPELRTSFFSSKHEYYDLGVSIWMRRNAKEPNQGYDAKAFAVAERASSRALLDEVASGGAVPAFVKAPADLLREQKQNQSRLDALFARLRRLADEPEKNSAQLAKVRTEIEQQLAASDGLEARIRAASGDTAAFNGAGSATPEKIAKLLGPRAALAKYWVGNDSAYLWLVTGGGLQSYELGTQREEIRELAGRWLENLQARSWQKQGEGLAERGRRIASADAAERSDATKLGGLLLGPLQGMPDVDRIYVVPDGPLASIPFAALRIAPAGNGTAENGPHRVVAQFEILTEPSESMLQILMRDETATAAAPAPRIAVFADAVYSASDPRVAGARPQLSPAADEAVTLRWATEAGMAHLPRLAASRDEAKTIALLNGNSNTNVDLGFKAAAETVRNKDWSAYTVVHFGVHALLNTERPAFSGVVLTMVHPNGEPQDGVLWLNDIYGLRMPVNLVVLSGCHTANGREIPGEGLEGLGRAFFFAGARSVMGSLWSVEDRETSLLMQRFYRNLIREGMSPAAALRKAQLATAGTAETAAPYFWAGFTVQGNGAQPVTPSPQARN